MSVAQLFPSYEQKRIAEAWVDEVCGKRPSTHPDDLASHYDAYSWEQDAQAEYDHALAVLIFADARRDYAADDSATVDISNSGVGPESDVIRLTQDDLGER